MNILSNLNAYIAELLNKYFTVIIMKSLLNSKIKMNFLFSSIVTIIENLK